MHQKFENFMTSTSAQVVAITLASIAVMSLFYAQLDALITMITLTAYVIFCCWTATISVKEYLTSKHFKDLQHRKLYSRIESNSISVLLILALSFVILLMMNRPIFSLVIISVTLISLYFGRSQALIEIELKPALTEMSENQYSRRLDIIRYAIEDLQKIESTAYLNLDLSDLIGSIDYCLNYLPIDYFFYQFEFFNWPNFNTINKIVKISQDSSADRFEDDVREMMINDVKSAKVSIDEAMHYLNDLERN